MQVDKQRISELVRKIQNGDKSAFDELYKLTSERAYFVALEFTKNNQDAEDILQESYIKALSKINELDKPESFSSWLNQIVANKSKDFLKKKKPMLFEAEENEVFEVLPDEDTSFSPEENLDQAELQKTVMEVLDELSEEKRACVMMMYFEELSVGEIAETLEIPEGTVKTRLFSARKDLKDKFAKRGITSAYSVAPIGVVIWALHRMSDEISKTFVGSGASAKVLEGITVAKASTAASVAGTTAATGTGIAAKTTALTVAQKVIAGVSVAAVVAGGTAGVVTVVNNDKNDNISTTACTEEYTTSPSLETTLAIEALGTVEFSETTDLSNNKTASINSSTSKNSTTSRQNTTNKSAAKSTTSAKQATTKKQTSTQKSTTTKKQTATQMPATTKRETTAKVTTAETETTEKKVTTTKETTTEKQTETAKPTTTQATTAAPAKVVVIYSIAEEKKEYTTTIPAGEPITAEKLSEEMQSKLGLSYVFFVGGDFPDSAESGVTYNYQADAVE